MRTGDERAAKKSEANLETGAMELDEDGRGKTWPEISNDIFGFVRAIGAVSTRTTGKEDSGPTEGRETTNGSESPISPREM